MASKKKSFNLDNPAEAFLFGLDDVPATELDPIPAEQEDAAQVQPAVKEHSSVRLVPVETRSQRIQLLFTPSLVKRIDKEAKRLRISRNELIINALEDYLGEEK